MAEIIEDTTMASWKRSLQHIIGNGLDYHDGEREFRQVLNFNMVLNSPHEDIIEPIRMLAETDKWIYPELEEIRSIILAKRRNPSYGLTYGQRIFSFNEEINQIDKYIVPLLKKNTNTRTAVVSLWNPLVDARLEATSKPGLCLCMFKVVDEELRLTAVIRNNDLFIGWPASLYQMDVLQEYVAGRINKAPGPLVFYSLTAHVYKENFEDVNKVLNSSRGI